MSRMMSRVRFAFRSVLGKGDQGEGPVGYLAIASLLGVLAVAFAPLMQGTIAPALSNTVVSLITKVGSLFG